MVGWFVCLTCEHKDICERGRGKFIRLFALVSVVVLVVEFKLVCLGETWSDLQGMVSHFIRVCCICDINISCGRIIIILG